MSFSRRKSASALFLIVSIVASIAGVASPAQAQTASSNSAMRRRAGAARNAGRRSVRRNIGTGVAAAPTPSPAPAVQLVPPVQQPDYLSGQAQVTVRGNEDPVIRVGLAQHGPVIIEFPASDNFFAVHPGGSQIVTFDESPTLATDHYLVFRAGSNFAATPENANARPEARASVSVQMQSGLFVTFLFYPVQDVARMAHRVVVMYARDEVVAARRAAGLAVNLDGRTPPQTAASQSTASRRIASADGNGRASNDDGANPPRDARAGVTLESGELIASAAQANRRNRRSIDLQREAQKVLREALASPARFNRWSAPMHGLSIAALAPVDLDATRRITVVAVKNTTQGGLRIVAGGPDLDLQTLNEAGEVVQVRSVTRLHLEASTLDGAIPAGASVYYAVVYETPVLDAAQRVRLSIAQTNAADQPASAEVAGGSR